MKKKLFSVLIEGQEHEKMRFFQTFKVLSGSIEEAKKYILQLKELEGQVFGIEDVYELNSQSQGIDISSNDKLIEKTGRIFFINDNEE